MSTTAPPFTRLPDYPGVAADLSELMDPDDCAPEGVTVRRGLVKAINRAGYHDCVFAARLEPCFYMQAVIREGEGGQWRHSMGHVGVADLTAVLRSITGGEGEYP